jgi:hypothetical protein
MRTTVEDCFSKEGASHAAGFSFSAGCISVLPSTGGRVVVDVEGRVGDNVKGTEWCGGFTTHLHVVSGHLTCFPA